MMAAAPRGVDAAACPADHGRPTGRVTTRDERGDDIARPSQEQKRGQEDRAPIRRNRASLLDRFFGNSTTETLA